MLKKIEDVKTVLLAEPLNRTIPPGGRGYSLSTSPLMVG
ncbi:hypothetical protein PYCH_00380 [Pyrococcus yayanosii CH1]|uniref:Uncharacterized protein n=1 Tax=Pyrococcus yayanosii (strain CH1 / JCM 16557) TaxID=529709 RepID=F8AFE4_PYRYC|nr:hypothetical protein PYCH_00380 [Pyrococcus yayanosii CH1]